jgi:hypothetical protein
LSAGASTVTFTALDVPLKDSVTPAMASATTFVGLLFSTGSSSR